MFLPGASILLLLLLLSQNPKQDAMVDPERGVTKVRGEAPGNKIMMRPREQVGGDTGSSGSGTDGGGGGMIQLNVRTQQ